jgi:hypothetical protein
MILTPSYARVNPISIISSFLLITSSSSGSECAYETLQKQVGIVK